MKSAMRCTLAEVATPVATLPTEAEVSKALDSCRSVYCDRHFHEVWNAFHTCQGLATWQLCNALHNRAGVKCPQVCGQSVGAYRLASGEATCQGVGNWPTG